MYSRILYKIKANTISENSQEVNIRGKKTFQWLREYDRKQEPLNTCPIGLHSTLSNYINHFDLSGPQKCSFVTTTNRSRNLFTRGAEF